MPTNDFLPYISHHGILGQKWGVRRYQNADGSLTDKGKKRYAKIVKKEEKKARKSVKKDRKHAYKNSSILSDSELDARIKRLKSEKQLRELTDETLKPGRTAFKSIKKKALITVAGSAAAGAVAYAGKKVLTDIGYDELARYVFPNPNKKK